ncbi:Uncharacterised protein [Enterobacter cloacae]|nr:Uncharacterised protein [Enterobacter cloacae]SAI94362.1 Uncharacterised protein [Enterobacter cloacae]
MTIIATTIMKNSGILLIEKSHQIMRNSGYLACPGIAKRPLASLHWIRN